MKLIRVVPLHVRFWGTVASLLMLNAITTLIAFLMGSASMKVENTGSVLLMASVPIVMVLLSFLFYGFGLASFVYWRKQLRAERETAKKTSAIAQQP